MTTKDRQVAIRMEAELYERIETYRDHLRETTGLSVSAADAIRKLIVMSLESEEKLMKRKR